jgi:hypothetical protein
MRRQVNGANGTSEEEKRLAASAAKLNAYAKNAERSVAEEEARLEARRRHISDQLLKGAALGDVEKKGD